MKYILLIMTCVSGFVFSQNIQFDYLLSYKNHRKEPSELKFDDTNIYLSSKDPSYIMNSYSIAGQKKANIKDYNTRFLYKFDIEKREGLSDVYYYDYAKKFIEINKDDKWFVNNVDIEKTGENIYFIKAYHKGRRVNFEIKLEVEKADKDLLYIDLPDISQDISMKILSEIKNKLGSENLVVKKAEYDFKTGYVFISELINVEKVNKKISLPSEIQERTKMQFDGQKEKK